MRDVSLYLTLAQVLPTLLIALVLELRGVLGAIFRYERDLRRQAIEVQRQLDKGDELDDCIDDELWRRKASLGTEIAEIRRNIRRYEGRYILVAGVFLIGEVASLAAPIFGVDRQFTIWLVGPVSLLATLVLGVCAISFPIFAIDLQGHLYRKRVRVDDED